MKIISIILIIAISSTLLIIFADNRICFDNATYASDMSYVKAASDHHLRSSRKSARSIYPKYLINANGNFLKSYEVHTELDKNVEKDERFTVFVGKNKMWWHLSDGSKQVTIIGGSDNYISYFNACQELILTTR